MKRPDPAERAAQYAAQARSAHDARGSDKPDPHAIRPGDPSPEQARRRWTIHPWGAEPFEVILTTAQTQRQMREHYPDVGGIIAVEP